MSVALWCLPAWRAFGTNTFTSVMFFRFFESIIIPGTLQDSFSFQRIKYLEAKKAECWLDCVWIYLFFLAEWFAVHYNLQCNGSRVSCVPVNLSGWLVLF